MLLDQFPQTIWALSLVQSLDQIPLIGWTTGSKEDTLPTDEPAIFSRFHGIMKREIWVPFFLGMIKSSFDDVSSSAVRTQVCTTAPKTKKGQQWSVTTDHAVQNSTYHQPRLLSTLCARCSQPCAWPSAGTTSAGLTSASWKTFLPVALDVDEMKCSSCNIIGILLVLFCELIDNP